MGTPSPVEKFTALLVEVFQSKKPSSGEQGTFDRANPDLFTKQYNELRKIVFATKQSAGLRALMSTYLDLYGQYAVNENLVQYYKSDQLFLFLVQQSVRVNDASVFEDWGPRLHDRKQSGHSALTERYLDLDTYFKNQVDVFVTATLNDRMNHRSLLDLLRDAWVKAHQPKDGSADTKAPPPTLDQLHAFDPRPLSRAAIEWQVRDVEAAWVAALADKKGNLTARTEEVPEQQGPRYEGDEDPPPSKARIFEVALAGFSRWMRETGRNDVLVLFQAARTIRLQATDHGIESNRELLLYGLYAITCIRLHGAGLKAGLFIANFDHFTTEEKQFFFDEIPGSKFLYRSDILAAVNGKLHDPTLALAAIGSLLSTWVRVTARMPALSLIPLAEALEVQKTLRQAGDLVGEINLAARNADPIKLRTILADPRNEESMDSLRKVGSRSHVVSELGRFLGTGRLAAGTGIGTVADAGAVGVVMITNDGRILIEFSALRPRLFHAPDYWLSSQQWGAMISDIYASTIGTVRLIEALFEFMGYIEVMIDGGMFGFIYQVIQNAAVEKLQEVLEEIDPFWGKVVGELIPLLIPQPNFERQIDAPWTETNDSSLLADHYSGKLAPEPMGDIEARLSAERTNFANFAGATERSLANGIPGTGERSITATGVSAEQRAASQLDADMEAIRYHAKITEYEYKMYSGFPITKSMLRDIENAVFGTKPIEIPVEWDKLLRQCEPARKMILAALESGGTVSFMEIPESLQNLMPFEYQASTMKSKFELHLTIDGERYRLDGIVGGGGSWYLGEAKMTYKEMTEIPGATMPDLHAKGKRNPDYSYHVAELDAVIEQLDRYSKLAHRFGFTGVAVVTNTETIWQTFEQASRHLPNVEIYLERLSELAEFKDRIAKWRASDAKKAAEAMTSQMNRGLKR